MNLSANEKQILWNALANTYQLYQTLTHEELAKKWGIKFRGHTESAKIRSAVQWEDTLCELCLNLTGKPL